LAHYTELPGTRIHLREASLGENTVWENSE